MFAPKGSGTWYAAGRLKATTGEPYIVYRLLAPVSSETESLKVIQPLISGLAATASVLGVALPEPHGLTGAGVGTFAGGGGAASPYRKVTADCSQGSPTPDVD